MLNIDFMIGCGSPHGENNCLIDSMIQCMHHAGLLKLPRHHRNLRRDACAAARAMLQGDIRDEHGYLEHYRHGASPPFWLLPFKLLLVISGGSGLGAFCR